MADHRIHGGTLLGLIAWQAHLRLENAEFTGLSAWQALVLVHSCLQLDAA